MSSRELTVCKVLFIKLFDESWDFLIQRILSCYEISSFVRLPYIFELRKLFAFRCSFAFLEATIFVFFLENFKKRNSRLFDFFYTLIKSLMKVRDNISLKSIVLLYCIFVLRNNALGIETFDNLSIICLSGYPEKLFIELIEYLFYCSVFFVCFT